MGDMSEKQKRKKKIKKAVQLIPNYAHVLSAVTTDYTLHSPQVIPLQNHLHVFPKQKEEKRLRDRKDNKSGQFARDWPRP